MVTSEASSLSGLRQRMVGAGLHDLARQLGQGHHSLPATVRELAKHRLSLAFSLQSLWRETRELLLVLLQPMQQAGHRNDWLYYLYAGIDTCQRTGDTHTEAILRYHLAELYRLMSDYTQAEQQFTQAANLILWNYGIRKCEISKKSI